jgi:hypothetical protein
LQVGPGSIGPNLTANVTAFSTIPPTSGRIMFQVNGPNVMVPTPYLVSVTGQTSTGTAFASGKPAALTINPPATILSLNPSSGQLGQSLSVTITSQYTNFVQGSTVANFGPGISVGGGTPGQAGPVTVTSPTTATAQLTIAASGTPGPQTVTIATGVQQASLGSAFTILPGGTGTPVITQVNPNSGQQGQQNLSVTITGQFTHFTQGSTTASFGTGVAIVSLTVNSATSATATLNIDAAGVTGMRNVTLTTGAEVATLANGFTVLLPNQACVQPLASLAGGRRIAVARISPMATQAQF